MKLYKKLTRDFTIIPNEIYRHGLSLKAIGLYTYVASKPDGWSFSMSGVAAQVNDGIDGVRSAVKELKDVGFLSIQRLRDDKGKLNDSSWFLLDKPILEKPTLGKPTLEKQPQVNTNKVSTKEVSTNISIAKQNFRDIKDLTEPVLKEIADHYSLSFTDVNKKKESMYLWLEEQPSRYLIKGKRRNLKMTLMNWIRRDLDSKKLIRKQTNVIPDLPELTEAEREANLGRIAQMKQSLMGVLR